MGIILAAVVALAAVCGYLLRGKPKMATATSSPATPSPAVSSTLAAVKADPVKGKLLSTSVTLVRKGLTHLASIIDAVLTENKPALENLAIVEGEHMLQGGPSMVLADLEAFFAQELAAKIADPAELQNLLATLTSTLGANHPALVAFAQSLLPAKPPANPLAAAAAAPKT